MAIRKGDSLKSTLQKDGTFSVVADVKDSEGVVKRFVTHTNDPDTFYANCRDMVDNPEPVDLEAERASLLEQKASIEAGIIVVDAKIAVKEIPLKEVIG